jgi:RimJ/RimL family protein N-acetyltransferase
MEFFSSILSREESDAMADRCTALIKERGWGFWAVEHEATARFIGFVGLHVPAADLPFSPCVEIGWRLAFECWGQGLATEAARAVLDVGFNKLGLDEIVSFTSQLNVRSQSVMKKLGMQAASNFEHPALPPESPLRTHVLYRLQR